MTKRPRLQLVCLDMAGTTVADAGAVMAAFGAALDEVKVPAARRPSMEDEVRRTMGASKIMVFRALLGDEDIAQQANRAFERAYDRQVESGAVAPIPGAEEVIRRLRVSGLQVALLTGFSASTRDRLLESLGWCELIDATLCPEEAGRGRPYPDLVLGALLVTGADDVAAVAVVGDTASDMESGLRAGASRRIGVLTGAHDEPALRAAGATDVVPSICEVPAVLP
ncbi:MAG TPA: phosphonatase-like hydrolase [Candidatus Dormibacteraeota bacterium]|nr:phosphonatase-like hydrolase [Candidatus Dormibacteraeota bacterium]